jgi:hypothetical protein
MSTVLGYARIAPGETGWRRRDAALRAAGADRVFIDHDEEMPPAARPAWDACLAALIEGDLLLVHRIDAVGGSSCTVIQVFTEPGAGGANLAPDRDGDRVRYAELWVQGRRRPDLRRPGGRLRDPLPDTSR